MHIISILTLKIREEQLMKTLNMIKLNLQYVFRSWLKAIGVIMSIVSVVFIFLTWEDVGIIKLCTKILILIGIVIVLLAWSFLWICVLKKKKVLWQSSSGKISICYGDLLKDSFDKKNEQYKLYVIPVNSAFDTIVDEDISLCSKPLVSPKSLHGRWIKKMLEEGISIDEIDTSIKECLCKQEKVPHTVLTIEEKKRGKRDIYDLGTVVAIRGMNNSIFLLLALTDFDENNNAHVSVENLENVIKSLIRYYDQYGQGNELIVPLMGTNLSRTGLGHDDSLRVITTLFQLYGNEIHGEVNVLIYNGDKDKVTINV